MGTNTTARSTHSVQRRQGLRDGLPELLCAVVAVHQREHLRRVRLRGSLSEAMCQEGTGSVRFVSVLFGKSHLLVRRDSACVLRTRRGSVRFGSVRFPTRFRRVPQLNGLVRFGSVQPVWFGCLFLPENQQQTSARI